MNTAGIKLYADNENDSPNGYVVLNGGQLNVGLYENSKPPLPNGRGAGTSVLPGNLKDYKPLIDAKVVANDP